MNNVAPEPVAFDATSTHYDAKDIFDTEFQPLILQLKALAEKYQLPLGVVCQFANREETAGTFSMRQVPENPARADGKARAILAGMQRTEALYASP